MFGEMTCDNTLVINGIQIERPVLRTPYLILRERLFNAAARLPGSKAAEVGMLWQTWRINKGY